MFKPTTRSNQRQIELKDGATLDARLKIAPFGVIPFGIYQDIVGRHSDLCRNLFDQAQAEVKKKLAADGGDFAEEIAAEIESIREQDKVAHEPDVIRNIAHSEVVLKHAPSLSRELAKALREFHRELVKWGIEPDIGRQNEKGEPHPLETADEVFEGVVYKVLSAAAIHVLDTLFAQVDGGWAPVLLLLGQEIEKAMRLDEAEKKSS